MGGLLANHTLVTSTLLVDSDLERSVALLPTSNPDSFTPAVSAKSHTPYFHLPTKSMDLVDSDPFPIPLTSRACFTWMNWFIFYFCLARLIDGIQRNRTPKLLDVFDFASCLIVLCLDYNILSPPMLCLFSSSTLEPQSKAGFCQSNTLPQSKHSDSHISPTVRLLGFSTFARSLPLIQAFYGRSYQMSKSHGSCTSTTGWTRCCPLPDYLGMGPDIMAPAYSNDFLPSLCGLCSQQGLLDHV